MLYIVSTPIGNLQDITLRALETLKECDYILAEDTRLSSKLVQHYSIEKKLISFHEFNEASREDSIIRDLAAGKKIALISDAGTPGIADPGERLIKRCIQEDIALTTIPGPCAVIAALVSSGFDTIPFQFLGFLPRKKGELILLLKTLLEYNGVSVCYESGERITKTVEEIMQLDSMRPIAIARELTKKFESLYRGTAQDVYKILSEMDVKGEIVLLIDKKEVSATPTSTLSNSQIQERVEAYQSAHEVSLKEAIQEVAKELSL
ncbi:MAG: Ribosomal small subunit methyltransferase, partial [Chlamydiia bacterium]|nr:Ribosomal small subunit methyltransferase [Chlamydiia bacterium]